MSQSLSAGWSVGRSDRTWAQPGPWLVLAACCFNVVLCLINTRHWMSVGPAQVVGASLLILGCGMAATWRQVDAGLAQIVLLALLTVAALRAFNPDLDAKIMFDLALMPVFYHLGQQSTPEAAERLLGWVMAIVVGVGLIEWLLPDTFQNWLDILSFYTNKGSVSADAINYNDSKFFVSAERSESAGRLLLPFIFGPHRISSIFLEPVSMGNFPLISLAWLLSVKRVWTISRMLLAAGTVLCVVLPDSRLAALSCVLLAVASRVQMHRSRLMAALPFVGLAALLAIGWSTLWPGETVAITSDDLPGRLSFSGKLLTSWGWPEWLGLAPSAVYTADTGYAYIINNLGLPAAAALWLWMFKRQPAPEAASLRGLFTIYAATSLCIGGSMVSIKTGALLWFLFGAVQAAPARE